MEWGPGTQNLAFWAPKAMPLKGRFANPNPRIVDTWRRWLNDLDEAAVWLSVLRASRFKLDE